MTQYIFFVSSTVPVRVVKSLGFNVNNNRHGSLIREDRTAFFVFSCARFCVRDFAAGLFSAFCVRSCARMYFLFAPTPTIP